MLLGLMSMKLTQAYKMTRGSKVRNKLRDIIRKYRTFIYVYICIEATSVAFFLYHTYICNVQFQLQIT